MLFFLKGLAGLLGGALAGVVVTLGIVVARVRIEGAYFADADELVSWIGAPLVLGPLVGAWIGAAHPPGRSTMTWCAFGLVVGIAGGGVLGALSDNPADSWAGRVIGGALGLLLGVSVALLRHYQRRRRHLLEGGDPHPPRPILLSLGVTALLLGPLVVVIARVNEPTPPSAPYLEPLPDSSEVESVILLLGDAGAARWESHPILPRVRAEVERWAGLLPDDSSVVVLLLGDIVYPAGVREPGSLFWAEDSATVAEQAALVAGRLALEAGARAFFVPGNHDWGDRRDNAGALQLSHLSDLLASLRATGLPVAVAPPGGSGGPQVVDVGEHLRLLLLDTSWWLLSNEEEPRGEVIAGVQDALASADGRTVLVAAHHPFDSGGPHGGLAALGRSLGIRLLLSLSGALLEDLRSSPYRELRQALLASFAEYGQPIVFAGGHDHSMQLLRGSGNAPSYTIVSGATSKLTGVGDAPGLVFARSEPGFARLLVLRDGSLHLTLVTAPAEYVSCPALDPQRARCMAEARAAYRVVWSETLSHEPR
jgi:hypothetical protein